MPTAPWRIVPSPCDAPEARAPIAVSDAESASRRQTEARVALSPERIAAAGFRLRLATDAEGRAFGGRGLTPSGGTRRGGLERLFVPSEAHRRGAAEALSGHAEALGLAPGLSVLRLKTMPANREPPALHVDLGFTCRRRFCGAPEGGSDISTKKPPEAPS